MSYPVELFDLRGGRNGVDSPISRLFPDNQVVESLNIDYDTSPLGARRLGGSNISITGGSAFSNTIHTILRWVPGGNESAAEMFAFDDATPRCKRLAGGTSWANVTWIGAPGAVTNPIRGIGFNGKFFLLFNGSQSRLHCYDPQLSTPKICAAGLVTPLAAPSVSNTGAGAYAAVLRYYRTRWITVYSNKMVKCSEPSASQPFTPSGAGTHARITNSGAINEEETHWEIEISTDGAVWNLFKGFALGTHIAAATTFFDDNSDPTTWLEAAPLAGTFSQLPSAKYGTTDGNRLILIGDWEDDTKGSQIIFTPVLGSLDRADDERWVNRSNLTMRLNINNRDGGDVVGCSDPIDGVIYLFKQRQTWRLVPTGDDTTPYTAKKISNVVGALSQEAIIMGEDADGNPCVYVLSYKGPYRIGIGGIKYLGRDLEDVWYGRGLYDVVGPFSPSSLAWTEEGRAAHGHYYPAKNQVWWYVSLGPSNPVGPVVRIRFHVKHGIISDRYGIRGGWSIDTLGTAGVDPIIYGSCMFSNTIGSNMSIDLKPYYCGATFIRKADTSGSDEPTFSAYIITKNIVPANRLGRNTGIADNILWAKAQTGVTVRQTIIGNTGLVSNVTADALLTAAGSETRVRRKFDAGLNSELGVIQLKIGDASAQAGTVTWSLESLEAMLNDEGSV